MIDSTGGGSPGREYRPFCPTVYDSLDPEERELVDRAMAGETPRLESRSDLPPDVIERDGEYLVFRGYSHYDWANPRTFGPTAIGLLGLGMVVLAVRGDVRERRVG